MCNQQHSMNVHGCICYQALQVPWLAPICMGLPPASPTLLSCSPPPTPLHICCQQFDCTLSVHTNHINVVTSLSLAIRHSYNYSLHCGCLYIKMTSLGTTCKCTCPFAMNYGQSGCSGSLPRYNTSIFQLIQVAT